MLELVRKLSVRAEFILVVLAAFGYTILGNVLLVLLTAGGTALADEPTITDASLRSLLSFELVVLTLVGALLYLRGWRLPRLGRPFAMPDLVAGLALAFGTYLMYYALVLAFSPPDSSSTQTYDFARNDLGLATLIAVSVVNPVFEEVLLCGYIVTVLKERRGFWTAVNFSLAVRLACHLYQGATGVIAIVPLGFVFTYWYARTGRLWPLIIAHALIDATGLWSLLAPE